MSQFLGNGLLFMAIVAAIGAGCWYLWKTRALSRGVASVRARLTKEKS